MDEFMLPLFKEDDIYTELMKTHLNDRRIVLNGEIGDALVEEATLYIMQWNKEDRDRKIAPENRKPIYIYLNSPGGDITYGLAFMSTIRSSITPIITIVLGMAASMASYIPMVSTKAYAFEDSTICLHDGSVGVMQTRRKANDVMSYVDRCSERMDKIVLQNTKITQEKLDEIADKEYYIFADEAKELGIIDAIIGVDVSIEEIL